MESDGLSSMRRYLTRSCNIVMLWAIGRHGCSLVRPIYIVLDYECLKE